MPFEKRGYTVIGAYEGGDNPNYHHSTDTADTVDYSYLTEVARLTLATLLHEATGLAGESTSPWDVYIRDNPNDTGDQPSLDPHWTSPDIWVRNNPPPADPADPNDPNHGEDPELGHEPPINDVPNYLYVRVHNRGLQPAAGCGVEAFRCDPGTAMLWPDDLHSIGLLNILGDVLPGSSVRVGPFIWTPHIVDHECLFAIVSGPGDHSIADCYDGSLQHSLLVQYDNNVGQRNVSPQNSFPGGKTKTTFLVRGSTAPSINRLSLDATALPPDSTIELRWPRRIANRAGTITGFLLRSQNPRWTVMQLAGGVEGVIQDLPLKEREAVALALTVDFSYQAEHLRVYPIIASQWQDGSLAGRLTIQITAVKDSEDYLYGNPRTHELHTIHCPLWNKISPRNKLPFATIKAARAHGFEGCHFCLPQYDTA